MNLQEVYNRLRQIDEELKTAEEDHRFDLEIAKGELEAAAMDMEMQQEMESDHYCYNEENTR
jgi:hypothetical protein